MKKLLSVLLVLVFAIAGMTAVAEGPGIDYHDYSQFPLVTDGSVTIRVAVIRDDATGIDADQMWFWKWLEQATGIHFEIEQILRSVRDEKLSLMFASGELPDLIYGMRLTTDELVRYGQGEGLLMPLNEFINEDVMPYACAWFEAYPKALAYATAPDGNVYTLPWIYMVDRLVGESDRVFMNETWARELGFEEVPETLDDFTAMLYAMKEDRPDSIPLGGGMEERNPMFYIMNAMGYVSEAYGYGTDIALRNGEAVIPVGDETFKEVLALMHQFYADGIIAEDFFTLDGTKLSASMNDGQLGVYPFVPFVVNSDPAFWQNWCSVKPLTSAYNDVQQWKKYDSFSIGQWAVSADSQYGELLARLADFYFSDIGTIYAWYGPMNGTDDCLGMTEGWVINPETNGREWPEITAGKYASTSDYMNQVGCSVNGGGIGNHSHTIGTSDIPLDYDLDNIMRYLYGAPIEPERIYDLDDPDPAFRYSMLHNISPYEVDGFPSVIYYDEDTTYAMNDLKTVLDTYMKTEIAKFIIGERSLDEFDAFVSELEDIGLREYEGYYQAAYADYLANLG